VRILRNRNPNRKLGLFIVSILVALVFSGCYDRKEVDEMAYVIAIGLDKGKTNYLKMTFQIANPIALGGGGGGGGGGNGEDGGGKSENITFTTVETPTIYSGLNMVNTYISKQLNLSHAKVVVFSEELAREGIGKYIHAMIRGREFRGNMFVAVSRGNAEDYLRSVTPKLEINPAKYFEYNYGSYTYTGFTPNVRLIDFYMKSESSSSQAVAVLAGVSKHESAEEFNLKDSTYQEKNRPSPLEGDYKAGDMPGVGFVKAETMGMVVFDGDKMVGELDGKETLYYLMLTGQFGTAYITLPDPFIENHFVVLSAKYSRRPAIKVKIEDDRPVISVRLKLEADILSIQSGENYESTDNVEILQRWTEEFIKKEITRLLEKTVSEFKSDTFGFGKYLQMKFITFSEWENCGWLSKYKDSIFDINVDMKIRRPGLMIRSVPLCSAKGEEVE
jgi:spore germination protein KC